MDNPGRKLPLTQDQAHGEACRRWGSHGYAETRRIGGHVRCAVGYCKRNGVGFYEGFIEKGWGKTFEQAFAMSDQIVITL